MHTKDSANRILSRSQILALPSFSVPASRSGVYFLIKEDSIVYVGMSRANILSRVSSHFENFPEGAFDRYVSIEVDKSLIVDIESAYILAFRPKFNRQFRRPNQKNLAGSGGQLTEACFADLVCFSLLYSSEKKRAVQGLVGSIDRFLNKLKVTRKDDGRTVYNVSDADLRVAGDLRFEKMFVENGWS